MLRTRMRGSLAAASFALFSVSSSWVMASAGQVAAVDPVAHAKSVMPSIDEWLRVHPNDQAGLYAKARASRDLGLYEDSRAAYSKLVALRPDDARLVLDLAAVNQRLKNYDEAIAGYNAVLAMPSTPESVKANIRLQIDMMNAANKRHHYWGNVTFGLLGQTNANAGPDDRFVEFWGVSFAMDEDSRPQSDISASLAAQLGYSYRLNESNDNIAVTGFVYTQHPSEVDNNRRDLLELQVGPSFNLDRFGLDGRLAIQGLVGTSFMDNDHYSDTAGIQTNTVLTINNLNQAIVGFSFKDEDHQKSEKHPRADDKDNKRSEVLLGWRHLWRPDVMLQGNVRYEDRNANEDWNGFDSVALILGASKNYASPVAWSQGNWMTGVRFSATKRTYDAPDLMQSMTQVDKTDMWQLDIEQSIPISRALTTRVGLTGTKADSNYKTSTWSDLSLNLAITYAF